MTPALLLTPLPWYSVDIRASPRTAPPPSKLAPVVVGKKGPPPPPMRVTVSITSPRRTPGPMPPLGDVGAADPVLLPAVEMDNGTLALLAPPPTSSGRRGLVRLPPPPLLAFLLPKFWWPPRLSDVWVGDLGGVRAAAAPTLLLLLRDELLSPGCCFTRFPCSRRFCCFSCEIFAFATAGSVWSTSSSRGHPPVSTTRWAASSQDLVVLPSFAPGPS